MFTIFKNSKKVTVITGILFFTFFSMTAFQNCSPRPLTTASELLHSSSTVQTAVISERKTNSSTIGQKSAYNKSVKIWLSPNLQSTDYLALMDSDWNTNRTVNIFKFHSGNLNEIDPNIDPNLFPEFKKRNGFNRLNSFGLELAIEVGVIKKMNDDSFCTGQGWKTAALNYINRVESNLNTGNHVEWIAMDEPLYQTKSDDSTCKISYNSALKITTDFMKTLVTAKPNLKLIDIEPYPAISIDEIQSWVQNLLDQGAPLAGLQLDLDREKQINFNDPAEQQKFIRLGEFLRERKLRFGIIYFGQKTKSNAAYIQDVLNFYVDTKFLRPYLTDLVFQSWHPSDNQKLEIPSNLINSIRPIESHLGLIQSSMNYSNTFEQGRTIVCQQPLSDIEYLAYYPDLRAANVDPKEHFNNYGKAEGRCPLEITSRLLNPPRIMPEPVNPRRTLPQPIDPPRIIPQPLPEPIIIRPPINAQPLPMPIVVPGDIKIYRMRNASGDYLITSNKIEGINAGYIYEGVFGFFPDPDTGRHAIYRCNSTSGHFVSTVSNCEGHTVEGILGYLVVANNSAGSLRPIYRIRTPSGYHLISYVESEGQSVGCVSEGLLGYGL